jgi:CubicO group peptidase (beta-lactamase class C family)
MQGIGSRQMQDTPFGGAGVFSTARDLAIFCQAFLDSGRYGDARILSPASVAAMTRDQIPGVAARFVTREIPIASWGYGWTVESTEKWKWYHGSLMPLGTFSHGGGGGIKLWADPKNQLVGVYMEACLRGDIETGEQFWNADLFENAVHAAIDD